MNIGYKEFIWKANILGSKHNTLDLSFIKKDLLIQKSSSFVKTNLDHAYLSKMFREVFHGATLISILDVNNICAPKGFYQLLSSSDMFCKKNISKELYLEMQYLQPEEFKNTFETFHNNALIEYVIK